MPAFNALVKELITEEPPVSATAVAGVNVTKPVDVPDAAAAAFTATTAVVATKAAAINGAASFSGGFFSVP